MEAIAYKVLTSEQMAALEADAFEGAPVDVADGYIHLSTAGQLTETVDRYFSRQQGIWVAAVDLEALGGAVVWEPSRGGALFPHIYGRLPLSVVLAYGPLERDDEGRVRLPVAG